MNKRQNIDMFTIAKELIDGFPEMQTLDILEEIITGLSIIMLDEKITLLELRETCWEDSNKIFDKIYVY